MREEARIGEEFEGGTMALLVHPRVMRIFMTDCFYFAPLSEQKKKIGTAMADLTSSWLLFTSKMGGSCFNFGCFEFTRVKARLLKPFGQKLFPKHGYWTMK